MQLGMIGLGRMGANMVRRLLKGGHECVVFDMSPKAVAELVKEKAVGTASLAEFVKSLTKPRAVWLMVPAGVVDKTIADLVPHLEAGDILIDGGNSYYIDDIRRAKELAPKSHPLCRCRHQRRRVGPRARLLHDDRRRDRHGEAPRPDLHHAGARPRRHRAHAGPREGGRHGRAGLAALRAQRRRPFRQDGAQRHRVRRHGGLRRGHGGPQGGQYRQAHRQGRRRNDAAARSRALPVRSQPARHRRTVAARQRHRLVAARPAGRGADRGSEPGRSSPAGCPIPAKAAGRSRRRSTRACRRMSCRRRSTSGSARAARRISPTSCSRPCATSSAGISRSRPDLVAHLGPRASRAPESSHMRVERETRTLTETRSMTKDELDQLAINTIRTLSIDAVQQAKSGHPGTPMALAPLVYTLWNRVMHFDPKDPIWPDRDRFVLSNGHASMLLWSVLHPDAHPGGERATTSAWASLRSRSTTSAISASSTARRRAIRNITGCRASRPRPVRWGRASPPASAWRSRASGWPAATTSRASSCSTTTSTPSAATAA